MDASIAERIKELMKTKKYSYRSLSEKTSIPRSTLNDNLNGRSEMSAENLYQIADALGVSVEYIRYGHEPNAIHNQIETIINDLCTKNLVIPTSNGVYLPKIKRVPSSVLTHDLELIDSFSNQKILIDLKYINKQLNFILYQEYCDSETIERNVKYIDRFMRVYPISFKTIVVAATKEQILIHAFNTLNNDGQDKLLDYAQDLVDNPKYRKD